MLLRDQKVFFDAYDLTGTMNTLGLSYGADMLEDTVLGDDTHSNAPGLKTVSASLQGLGDAAAYDAALFASIGAASAKPLTFSNTATPGAVAYFFNAGMAKYNQDGKVGDLLRYSLDAVTGKTATATARLVRGLLMEKATALVTTTAGTARQLGAVPAGKKMFAALHVFSKSGTPTLDVTIKSDATNSFSGSETLRLTFAQMTDVGSQMIEVDGAITNTWWKPTMTVGGGSPSMSYALVMGVK